MWFAAAVAVLLGVMAWPAYSSSRFLIAFVEAVLGARIDITWLNRLRFGVLATMGLALTGESAFA